MAERRMFSKSIIMSDAFIDLPASTKCLYFYLGMNSDDEGFVGNPRSIQRMVGATDDDLKILIAKRFLLAFDSGVVVIKHFLIHNYLQRDRVKPTTYIRERKLVMIGDNKAYTESELIADASDEAMYTKCIQNGYKPYTQDRLDENSIVYNTIVQSQGENETKNAEKDALFDQFWAAYPRKENKKTAKTAFMRIAKLQETFPKIMAALDKQKASTQWREQNGKFVPHPTTWLRGERWNDEAKNYGDGYHPENSSFDTDDFFRKALERSIREYPKK